MNTKFSQIVFAGLVLASLSTLSVLTPVASASTLTSLGRSVSGIHASSAHISLPPKKGPGK